MTVFTVTVPVKLTVKTWHQTSMLVMAFMIFVVVLQLQNTNDTDTDFITHLRLG